MHNLLKKYLLSFFFCVAAACSALNAAAQESPDTGITVTEPDTTTSTSIDGEYVEPPAPTVYNSALPTDAQWQQATSDRAYWYRNEREVVKEPSGPPKEDNFIYFILSILHFFGTALGKLLLWICLFLIIGYVIYRIIKGQGNGLFGAQDRKSGSEIGELTEQGLLDADWEGQMRAAVQAGDTRAAIRFSYLRLLQLLQQEGHITFRPDKTNAEYYRELADKPQRQTFRSMARQYEWAWYGNFLPGKEALDSYMHSFQQLKQSLGAA